MAQGFTSGYSADAGSADVGNGPVLLPWRRHSSSIGYGSRRHRNHTRPQPNVYCNHRRECLFIICNWRVLYFIFKRGCRSRCGGTLYSGLSHGTWLFRPEPAGHPSSNYQRLWPCDPFCRPRLLCRFSAARIDGHHRCLFWRFNASRSKRNDPLSEPTSYTQAPQSNEASLVALTSHLFVPVGHGGAGDLFCRALTHFAYGRSSHHRGFTSAFSPKAERNGYHALRQGDTCQKAGHLFLHPGSRLDHLMTNAVAGSERAHGYLYDHARPIKPSLQRIEIRK